MAFTKDEAITVVVSRASPGRQAPCCAAPRGGLGPTLALPRLAARCGRRAPFTPHPSLLLPPPPLPRCPDVGPVNNPSETYGYFTLPFCGKDGSSVDQDLGESLTGDRKVETPYEINFRKDVEFKEVCVKVRHTR